jgi:hypothetical protein
MFFEHYYISNQICQQANGLNPLSAHNMGIQNTTFLVQCSKCFKAQSRTLRIEDKTNRRLFQGKVFLGLGLLRYRSHPPERFFAFFYRNCLESEVNAGPLRKKLDQRHMEDKMYLYIKTAKIRVSHNRFFIAMLQHIEYMIFDRASRVPDQIPSLLAVYSCIVIDSNLHIVSIQHCKNGDNSGVSLESEAA